MASPSLQQQAYLEALGFAQANWGSSGPDYGTVTFAPPPPETVIYAQQGAFNPGIVSDIRLRAYYPPTRELRDVSPYVQTVTYTEAEGQAGIMGELDFIDLDEPGALLDYKNNLDSVRAFLSLNGLIMIFETCGPGLPFVERQRWINWTPTVGAPGDDSLQFYDALVYIANGQISVGYQNMTASEISADICRVFNIPVASLVRASYKIPYFLFTGSIYDAIATAYAFERHMTGKYFYITTNRGQLVVRRAQSTLHDPNFVFLLDPNTNVRSPMTFSRTLDQYAGGIIPTGTDQAGDPEYINVGTINPNSVVTPQQGTADAAAAGLTAAQAAAATGSGGQSSISAAEHQNQLAASMLFGNLIYNAKLDSIRDPNYSKTAAQLLSNALARADKDLELVADGNVLLRQGARVHVLGYPLDLFVRSITQTISRTDHTMQLSLAWREFEVSDMEDYHSVQEAGAQYAQVQNETSAAGVAAQVKAAGSNANVPSSGTSGQGAAPTVKAAAAKFGVPTNILWGVFGMETSFGSDVSSNSDGTAGAFQFTAADKGTGYTYPMTNSLTPTIFKEQAIAAAAYLALLYQQNGKNWDTALRAYSGEPLSGPLLSGGYDLALVQAKAASNPIS